MELNNENNQNSLRNNEEHINIIRSSNNSINSNNNNDDDDDDDDDDVNNHNNEITPNYMVHNEEPNFIIHNEEHNNENGLNLTINVEDLIAEPNEARQFINNRHRINNQFERHNDFGFHKSRKGINYYKNNLKDLEDIEKELYINNSVINNKIQGTMHNQSSIFYVLKDITSSNIIYICGKNNFGKSKNKSKSVIPLVITPIKDSNKYYCGFFFHNNYNTYFNKIPKIININLFKDNNNFKYGIFNIFKQ